MRKFCWWLMVVLFVGLAGACSREQTVRCSTGIDYRSAESAGLLRVPDDLDVPDETEALIVPGPTPPRETNENSVSCLEYSPAFRGADEDEDED